MSSPFSLVLTGQSLIQHDVRRVSDEGFAAVKELTRKADVAFTNFETTILGRHGGWPLKGSAFGCSPAAVLDALADMGFSALALSNNHAFDLGPSGVLSTLEEVACRGFLHAGIGIDAAAARQAGVKEFKTGKVALVAMDAGPGPAIMFADNATEARPARPGVNKLDVFRVFEVDDRNFANLLSIQEAFQSNPMERANYAQPDDPRTLTSPDEIDFYGTIFRRAPENRRGIVIDEASLSDHLATIRKVASEGTFVIAYLHHHHWEPSWRDVPSWVQFFARSCIEAGANVFVSHGAPVLQAIEIYRGAPIFFGLGNFLFHLPEGEEGWGAPEVWKSVVANCRFDEARRLRSIDLVPVVIGGEQRLMEGNYHERLVPVLATARLARGMIEDLAERSRKHGTDLRAAGDRGIISL